MNGLIHNETITFTCHTGHIYYTANGVYDTDVQYLWSVNNWKMKIGSEIYTLYTMQFSQSFLTITCEVFVKLTRVRAIHGSKSVYIQLSSKPLN